MNESSPVASKPPQQQSWSEWFEETKEKAQLMAETAQKIATEKTAELTKQAKELTDNYDLEYSRKLILKTIGSPTADSKTQQNINQPPRKSFFDLTYITENLIAMAFPYESNDKHANMEGGNDINIVSKFLNQRHKNHFMIWNISEDSYNYSSFNDQVLE